ncbi:P-loop containing nucleoside triphosphate hydrolase protein [Gorgonomyces haynaldii]|nr:P-loop containing nucleoside triphosphate hydrolase protein [Gorgonomyces haynaldii]
MSDLVLLPQTKQVLQSLVTLPLLRPELFKQGVLGRSSINGVLLFGPPGTGKTMLAKAIAKSSGAKFMSVALSDIFEKYVGEGEKNVKAIFTLARKISPCIVFIDEVDALFSARRTNDSNSTRREIMNEFMAEWDGLTSNNNGIIVLGATNRPFDLDDAILRRMPRRVLIDLPTEEARLKILQVHLQGEQVSPDLNLQDLAKRTNLYSGSDLKNLCVAAALQRVKLDILRSFKSKDGSLNEQDVREQVNQIQDWSSMDLQGLEIKTTDLDHYHFEQAMKEITPSLTDEMNSLVELRKWNTQFGDAQKQKKTAWGFVPTKLM